MARTSADTSIPPPLRALGGWADASWFDPSILDETEVVGITLPRLEGGRKQNFDLADRFAPRRAAKKPPPGTEPKSPPAGIGQVLEEIGVTRAAMFRRPKFFIEAAPTLFFAEIPAAKLKVRAAEALRRTLIANAGRGCVLRQDTAAIVAMFWPSTEVEITAFIRAAHPPYPLHGHFDLAEEERSRSAAAKRGLLKGARAAEPGGADTRERRRHEAEKDRLLQELDRMRAKIADLQRSQSASSAMETLGLDDARLKSMLRLLHPDRHGNSEAANEAAKWVNGLRDILKANRTPAS